MKKKIYFNNLNSKTGTMIVVFMILFLIMYFITVLFKVENIYTKLLLPLSNVMLMFYLGKTLFYKNSVQWNKKGMTLRVNQIFKGTNIKFEEVKSVQTENKQLKIELRSNKVLEFNLSHIEDVDIQKLDNIIKQKLDLGLTPNF